MAVNLQNDPLVRADEGAKSVNDFALMVATKNGSGSQTSNEVLIRSLFKMGIPVSGKNLFPSNIKGLPTWYTIRASKDGYIARRATTEIAVCFNIDTIAEDIANLPAGGIAIINGDLKHTATREDITVYSLPVKEMVATPDIPADFRDRIANMVYVGAVAYLFNIPLDIINAALLDTFSGKAKPAALNFGVVQRAYEWAQTSFGTPNARYTFEDISAQGLTKGKILITGNEAAALGALFGGITVAAWYPITPSTSMIDAVMDHKDIRKDADGRDTVAIVQAEDELAAIGMIIGAGWAGARALTATSGPGISLMAEFTGLAYFAEIPCVIWNIARMGPSTGLPTRTSQGDLTFMYFLGHGDSRHIVLLPSSMEECFAMGWQAFDMADHFQTPIFVMSDLDLGMNLWMSEPFAYPDQPIHQGKRLNAEQLESFIADKGEWYRYRDYDGDAIGYRTVPGTDHPRAAYFTRGTGHNDRATYSERADDWVANMDRLRRKFESTRNHALVPQPVVDYDASKPVGIISYGSNDPAIEEARERLAAEGVQTNYLRVRALPFADRVHEFVRQHERVYVIENNFDGQMHGLLRMEIPQDTTHMISLALGDTLPMTARWITEMMLKHEGK